ncbi:MAG: type III secretion system inner membrane ring subunit SctD [Rhabdochlamydiaceae bacterium]|nr:type III secretion system inner membrane ring subunit SctD [Candidatus Amphrikana amoebophyrae]
MPAVLIAEEGLLSGINIPLTEEDEWILGRDPDVCFHVLEDPQVSRKHVMLRKEHESYFIENLSATNPVQVNGDIVVDPVELQDEDRIQIGSTTFQFLLQMPNTTPTDHLNSDNEDEEDNNKVGPNSQKSPLDEIDDQPSIDLGTLTFSNDIQTRWMIKVVSGPNSGAEFPLVEGQSYSLGKDPIHSDILFSDLSVSRQHANLHLSQEGSLTIEDLGSRNGVLINASLSEGTTPLNSQDLVALGTTAFLVIDRESVRETIYSPPSMATYSDHELSDKEKKESEEKANALAEELTLKRNWKQTFIPTKHILFAILVLLVVFSGIIGTFSLFKTTPITMAVRDDDAQIRKIIKDFPSVQYSYTSNNGMLFLTGHVLTDVEYQELLYLIKSQSFVKQIDDNVVIDEFVWKNMNALLYKNPAWRSVLFTGTAPGKFVLKGYLQTLTEFAQLSEYVNRNFSYLDLLKNEVVVDTNLETNVQTLLTEGNFNNVTFQFSSGELIFSGRVAQANTKAFNSLLSQIDALPGVRQIKNYVVYTSHSSARIDITSRFQVTGTSKYGNENQFVLINGKILSTGEHLDGMVITAINPQTVFLEKEGIKYRIDYNLQ